MAIGKMEFEGNASFSIADVSCVCAKCNNRDTENASVEFNFREKKVYSLCSKCKHMNEMFFGKDMPPPLPRIGVGH
jgi:hypothetical protein